METENFPIYRKSEAYQLKPCPFCGKPAKTVVSALDDSIIVEVCCSGACYAQQSDRVQDRCSFDTIVRAMNNACLAWNRRSL